MSTPLATLFAIRHIPTGNFLPSGRSRGFTHDEPMSPSVKPPRLFTSRRGAHLALRAWLAGEWTETFSSSYDEWGGGVEPDGHEIEARPHRRASEMEIVEIGLSVLCPGAACDASCACDGSQNYQATNDSALTVEQCMEIESYLASLRPGAWTRETVLNYLARFDFEGASV